MGVCIKENTLDPYGIFPVLCIGIFLFNLLFTEFWKSIFPKHMRTKSIFPKHTMTSEGSAATVPAFASDRGDQFPGLRLGMQAAGIPFYWAYPYHQWYEKRRAAAKAVAIPFYMSGDSTPPEWGFHFT